MSETKVDTNEFKSFVIIIKNHYYPSYSYRTVIENPKYTALDLKNNIQNNHKGKPKINTQTLVYGGKILKDNDILYDIIISRNKNNIITQTINIHLALQGGSKAAVDIGLIPKKIVDDLNMNNNNDSKNNTQFMDRPPPIPPPPHLYSRSRSMPNLYHHVGMPYAPPALVNQSSEMLHNNHIGNQMHRQYSNPYLYGHFSQSYSDINYYQQYYRQYYGNQSNGYIQSQVPNQLPSQINKDNNNNNDNKNDANNQNNNNRQNANILQYGMRQRRRHVGNRNINFANNIDNQNNQNNNANNNNNNVNANNNNNENNNNDNNNGGFVNLVLQLFNVNMIVRLGIFVWLFGSHLSKTRWNYLVFGLVLYYLYVNFISIYK